MNDISQEDIKVIQSTNYGKIAVVWQGEGTYYRVPKLGLWLRINCQQVAALVEKTKTETIQL